MANSAVNPYEYMDDTSIDSDLLCSICREPCKEPYCTPCDHLFCRQCITNWHRSRSSCPNCRKSMVRNALRPATRIVCQMINNLRMKCKQCGQQNLLRIDIDDHIGLVCPKSIVPCSSVKTKCPWIGQRDQLDEHLLHCVSKFLTTTIDEFNVDSQNFKRKLEQIEGKCKQEEITLNKMIEDINETIQTTAAVRNIDLSTLRSRFDDFKRDIQSNTKRLNTFEQQFKKMKTESECVQYEIEHTDKQFEQHEIDIKQFVRNFKLMQELVFDNRNSVLKNSLEQQESNSSIDLSRRQLIDQDMEIVVEQVTMNQQCLELDLRQNLITEEGVTVLASLLNSPTTIKILYLADNSVHDIGVFHLANALSIPNSILTKLDLNSNNITYEGAKYLANMLKTNKTLEYLLLNNNRLGDAGMQSLTVVLTHDNKTLKELHLSNNQLTSLATINSFIRMIQLNQSLEKFNIKHCGLSEENIIKLQQVVKYKSNFSLDI